MPSLSDLLGLCKLKVVALILLTAVVGMLLAEPYLPNLVLVIVASAGIGLSAASAAVFNHVVDEKIDLQMSRTDQRPLPQGKVSRNQALVWGVFLGVVGLGLLILFVNWLTAILTFISLIGYAVIYTMYLKRATPQNIVIGGAAGAFPPMVGWVAASGSISIEAVGMFMLIFMWTPPHFWALALFMNEDYSKAGIPMLTVTHGKRSTRNHILIYTILLTPFSIGLAFTAIGGPIYFVLSVALSLMFLTGARKVFLRSEDGAIEDNYLEERKLFKLSLFYLFLLFAALLAEASLKSFDLNLMAWPQVF